MAVLMSYSDQQIVPNKDPAFTGNLLCVVSMIAWAAGFPASDYLLPNWDPLALIAFRLAGAAIFLLPIWALLDGPKAVLHARWGRGTLVGGFAFGFGAYFLLLAQSLTDPITVSIIASCTPIAATLLEVVFEKRVLNRYFLLGLVASIIGGVVALGPVEIGSLGLGAAIAIMSLFLFSWGSYAAVKDFPELSAIGRTTITLAGGAIFSVVGFLIAIETKTISLPNIVYDLPTLWALTIYTIAALALSQVLWIMSVGRLGVAVASFHINIAPFYVMLILLALGASWNWFQAIGAAIVALGVFVSQIKPPIRRLG